MPFYMVRNDIVRMDTDAIVNAANPALAPGGGVCGAVFHAAGYEQLDRACRRLGGCATGDAVITKGYQLNAKYIIHAVGPVWQGGGSGEGELLRSCYLRSLALAERHRCSSVAFPLISSGIYGYPKQEALDIAVAAIRNFLQTHEMTVYLVLFGRDSLSAGQNRFSDIQSYIDDHYVEHAPYVRDRGENVSFALFTPQPQETSYPDFDHASPQESPVFNAAPEASERPTTAKSDAETGLFSRKRSLRDVVLHLDDSFSKTLFRLIDERGLTDTEVYKRANLDRKLFSKLRKDSYQPGKQTVLALCIALRLSLDETRDLLARAGFALSPSNKFDVIIEYFIQNSQYDIYQINEALFAFDQKLLGA